MSETAKRYGFDDFQKDAARTGGTDLLPENRDKGLNCAALGLCGESGEFADIVKKVQHHGVPLTPELTAKLRKELGDVLWYVAHGCNVMGWRMEDIAEENRDKLRARYPEGFSTAASIERRDVIDEANVSARYPYSGLTEAECAELETAGWSEVFTSAFFPPPWSSHGELCTPQGALARVRAKNGGAK